MDNYLEHIYGQLAAPDYLATQLQGKPEDYNEVTQSYLKIEIKCFLHWSKFSVA